MVLCGSNGYERKYYFNEEFASLPDEVKKEWSETIDKELTSRLDEELFERIVDFYMEAIGK